MPGSIFHVHAVKKILFSMKNKAVLAGILIFTLAINVVSFHTTPTALAASTPTLAVNANQVLRSVTHVASGGLYGLGSDTTPDDSMVIPLHPKVFTQMAPN